MSILPVSIEDTKSKLRRSFLFYGKSSFIAKYYLKTKLRYVVLLSSTIVVTVFFLISQQYRHVLQIWPLSTHPIDKSVCLFQEKTDYKPFFVYDWANRVFQFDASANEYKRASSPAELLFRKYNSHQNYTAAINGNRQHFYNIHSHNDYWRSHPLFDALERNYKSIEADVWYRPSSKLQSSCTNSLALGAVSRNQTNMTKEAELYVGHHLYLLSEYKTLNSLYVDLLAEILEDRNARLNGLFQGVFHNFPQKSLNFIIDIKSKESYLVYQLLLRKLASIKKYLSYYDFEKKALVENQINIILSGYVPLNELLKEDKIHEANGAGKRYVFTDADTLNPSQNQSLAKLSILSSTSYGGLLKSSSSTGSEDSTSAPSNPQSTHNHSYGFLNEHQLLYLKLKTSEARNQSSNLDTRIWGVPQLHYSFDTFSPSSLWSKMLSFFSISNEKAKQVDVANWKDLMLKGGITMMNMDDLDFGMEVYNNVMGW